MKKRITRILTILLLFLSFIYLPFTVGVAEAKITVTNVKLSKSNVSLYVGDTYKLNVTVSPKKESKKNITFSSSNKNIATVTQSGQIKGIKAGDAIIKVRLTNGKTYQCKVHVKNIAVKSVSITSDLSTSTLLEGDTIKVVATIFPSNATIKDITYKSNDSSIATVSDNGTITAIKAGDVSITAESHNGKKDTIKLSIVKLPILNVRNTQISLGDKTEDVINKLGEPNRIDKSYIGSKAYVYNSDYTKFVMIYLENDKVVGYYSDSTDFSCNHVKYGDSTSNDLLSNEIYSLSYYIDKIGTNLVTGVKVISSDATINSLDSVMSSMEIQIFDLTNSIRARNNVGLLQWSELVYQTAKNHSIDMATNDYFSHTALNGLSPFDRMKSNGIKYRYAAENLIAGHGDSTDSSYGWFQSEGHRKNMLHPNLYYLGVGGSTGGTYSNYFTQNFYS